MKQRYLLIASLTSLFVLTLGFNPATAKTLLDDFSGEYLDVTKWESQYWDSQDSTVTDFVREVANGKLVSKFGIESGTTGRNRIAFQNPSSIYAIEAKINIVETNLTSGAGFARIDGTFYNTQTSGTDAKGNIWAGVLLYNDGDGLKAIYEIDEATAGDWSAWNIVSTGNISADKLTTNQDYIVKIEYDEANTKLTFSVGSDSIVVDDSVLPERKRAAVNGGRTLTTGIDNATSGTNFVYALFDDVYINNQGTVYDDFTNASLDKAKWDLLDYGRGLLDGKVILHVQTEDERKSANIEPKNQATNYLEAKFLIESSAQIPAGKTGFARIGGNYYNESRGPGSGLDYDGEIGNAWVTNRIELDSNNNLRAYCAVWVSDMPDGWDSNAPNIFFQEFTTPIAFDTAYTLSIEYTGSSFIFKCNNESYEYKINSPQYPLENGPYRTLQARVYADPGQSGQIKVLVDDVYIEGVDDSDGDGDGDGGGDGGGGGGGGGCFISTMRK